MNNKKVLIVSSSILLLDIVTFFLQKYEYEYPILARTFLSIYGLVFWLLPQIFIILVVWLSYFKKLTSGKLIFYSVFNLIINMTIVPLGVGFSGLRYSVYVYFWIPILLLNIYLITLGAKKE